MDVRHLAVMFVAVAGISYVSSCSSSYIQPPEFDGNRAFDYLVEQVAFGPRVPGSEASARCRTYYYDFFEQHGMEVDSQVFEYFDRYSQQNIRMVNVMASFRAGNPGNERAIVLMAHYDSRPRTDYASVPELRDKPIDGANDGASGVAVLMEMANMFADQPPPCPVDIVLVDGEDWGKEGDHAAYLIGSREFAKSGIRERYAFGIVVDLIGDSHQQIYREGYSERFAKDLNDAVWTSAARLEVTTFVDTVGHFVLDDHLSLNSAGVPAVNIIDFDYPYWHTELDTPDKCSAESLENVGKVLAEIIYNSSLWPKK